MSIRGSLDVVTTEYAAGWAYSSERGGGIFVQAMLNQEIIGEAAASLHRSDLADIGLGDGRCGFNINFHRQIDPLYLPFVVVRLEGSDTELPRWTPTGFVEFFKSLYAAYPMTARFRSVFGGLWTDRIDAAALLRGKTDIGLVHENDAPIIARLIHDGFTELQDQPSLVDVTNVLTLNLVSSVMTSDVIRILELVFEDRAVVLSAEILNARHPIGQASAELQLPSPGECLEVLASLSTHGVQVDTVRDSQKLPEFTRDGASRWVSPVVLSTSDADLCQHGLLDRRILHPGSLAIVGPGLLHAVHCNGEIKALRLLAVPARAVPLQRLCDEGRQEAMTQNGVRIWI